MSLHDLYKKGLRGGSRPDRGASADEMVRARLTGHEHRMLTENAAAIGEDISSYVRIAISTFPHAVKCVALLRDAAVQRALSSVESQILQLLSPIDWHDAGGGHLELAPKDRPEKQSTLTEQAVLDLADLQGYVVMPADPAAAAVLGQLVVRLIARGRLRRVSTDPARRLTNEELSRGAPNAAVGVVRVRTEAAARHTTKTSTKANRLLAALASKRELTLENAAKDAGLTFEDATHAAQDLGARGYAEVWSLSGSDEIETIELTDQGRIVARQLSRKR